MPSNFTASEWQSLTFAPLWVFHAVAGADGKVDKKEFTAFAGEVAEGSLYKSKLLRDVLISFAENFESIMKDYLADSRNVLKGLQDVKEILAAKADPDDRHKFKGGLVSIGVQVANASGGVLGMGDKMSRDEKYALATAMSALDFHADQGG